MADQEGKREPWRPLPNGILSQGPDAWFPGNLMLGIFYALLVNRANWKDGYGMLKRQRIALKRGQLVFGREKFAGLFKGNKPAQECFSPQRIRSMLEQLATSKPPAINQQSNQQGTIITICNYDELFVFRPIGQPAEQPASNQQVTTSDTRYKETKEFPPKPPHGGAREKSNLRSLRRRPAPCSCSDSGEVAIRRQGADGVWEVGFAGCPNCPRGAGRWAIADAVRFGWELSKSQN